MDDNNPSSFDLGAILGAYISFLVLIWIVCAVIASGVAPQKRQLEFFLLTLFILGPLGVGFAAVAQAREPVVPDRSRYICTRCAAPQYVSDSNDTFRCWRCDESIQIKLSRFGRTSVGTVPRKSDVPKGRRRFLCTRCGVEQNIPENATSYDCWQCSEHFTIKSKKQPTTKIATK